MNRFGLSEREIQEILIQVKKFPIKKVGIFGSRARGDYKDTSDIDLVVKGDLDFFDTLELKRLLEEEVLTIRSFDVINYSLIDDPKFKQQIDKEVLFLF